jgi:hypothetical protein
MVSLEERVILLSFFFFFHFSLLKAEEGPWWLVSLWLYGRRYYQGCCGGCDDTRAVSKFVSGWKDQGVRLLWTKR